MGRISHAYRGNATQLFSGVSGDQNVQLRPIQILSRYKRISALYEWKLNEKFTIDAVIFGNRFHGSLLLLTISRQKVEGANSLLNGDGYFVILRWFWKRGRCRELWTHISHLVCGILLNIIDFGVEKQLN